MPPGGRRIWVRSRWGPGVETGMGAGGRGPGENLVPEPIELQVTHFPAGDEMSPYERLLGDAMDGDAMLFAREDGVEAAWAVVQGILGNAVPALQYEPGSWGPAAAMKLAADLGGLHCPAR